jgi:hypothetical protein
MRISAVLFLMSAGSAFALPDCTAAFGAGSGSALTTVGQSIQLRNLSINCYDWRMSYQAQGFSAVSVIVESAPDVANSPGTWGTFSVPEVSNPIQGVNPNTNTAQASVYLRGAPAWVRVRLVSATGSGSVSGKLYGCAEPGCGSGMAFSAAAATGCPNPCPVTQSGVWNVGVTGVSGNVSVDGPDAAGAAPTQNPVSFAGFDGTLLRRIKTDTSGDAIAVGPDATGAAPTKNPLAVAGFDGTNLRPIKTDTSGDAIAVGPDATGAAPTKNPLAVAGFDGTNLRPIKTDTSGDAIAVGPDAAGAPPTKNPVTVAGSDGTNLETIKTDTSGRPIVVGAAADGSATAGNPLYVGGNDGTNAKAFKVASAANNTSTIQTGVMLHEKGARWSVSSVTGSNTQASASKAAGAAGVRHVADCVQFSAESTAAIVATQDDVILRDGATGAGTVLMQWRNAVVSAAAAQIGQALTFCGLSLVGSSATAMTLEYANGITNVLMSVTLSGYDVQ